MLTIVKLSDVNGEPKVLLDLPDGLKNGDPVALRFSVSRQTEGRSEILDVHGKFLVTAVGYDATRTPPRRLLSVDSSSRPPTWRSIKKRNLGARRLGPAVFPRTPLA